MMTMYSDDDLQKGYKDFVLYWKAKPYLLVYDDDEEDWRTSLFQIERTAEEEGKEPDATKIAQSMDSVRLYRILRFFKTMQGFYEGNLDLTGRHPSRLAEIVPKWSSYLQDFSELFACAHRSVTLVSSWVPGHTFEEESYTFDNPDMAEKFMSKWKIPEFVDFSGLVCHTKSTLESISRNTGGPRIQKLCLVDLPFEILDVIFYHSCLSDARLLSATCRQLREIGEPHVLGDRTIVLKRDSLRFPSEDMEISDLPLDDYIISSAFAARDEALALCQFLLNRRDLLNRLKTLFVGDKCIGNSLDPPSIRDYPLSELDGGNFYSPFYKSLENVISSSVNLTELTLLRITMALDIISCLCNLPNLDLLVLSVCTITHEARRALSTAAAGAFACSARCLQIDDPAPSSYYAMIFCPNATNFSAYALRSSLLPPPEIIWEKCQFLATLKYLYLGRISLVNIPIFVEWIRRSLHGISPQITHFKLQTEYPISDTEIESYLEALGTTPLKVLSIEGALHADLSLFDWIANHFPNLQGLTVLRRESTRSRDTKPIIWPLPTWMYAQCLSAFPKLEYFGWNNDKISEQYTTYPLRFLEDPSLANNYREICRNERISIRDDNTPILFDPPTATLQRIKGLTTGSLPTFVDIGNNFGASSIAEDSILKQLRLAGKKSAFMGDDTWMSVFPDAFEPNMTFPYDSFNVEDLHTVDEGVIEHLFPLLEDPSKPFDFLVGHFLGVDHVGHRVGPDHPSMKTKLSQMNDVLKRVVDLLDDETLLVVLGDHGMDLSGDHGGDGAHETSAALWVYSKGPAITQAHLYPPPSGLLRYTYFPGTTVRHRNIQQIDILPTLSLLLGLPIPYNNLGSVIPELFWRDRTGTELLRALEINSAQIKQYLDTYRASPSGGELNDSWNSIEAAWTATKISSSVHDNNFVKYSNFNWVALGACRSMWAQFNPLLMGLGLSVLGVGLIATWAVWSGLSASRHMWYDWIDLHLGRCLRGIAGGAILGVAAYVLLGTFIPGIDALDYALFFAPLLSSLIVIASSPPNLSFKALKSTPILLILHALAFFSNSFTFWEDRIAPFLLVSSIAPSVFVGLSAPVTRLRLRIVGFSILFAVCVRLMAMSTVCREEQGSYCHVTFYSSSSLPSPPLVVLALAIPAALGIPYALRRYLRISRSDVGVARSFIPLILQPALLAGSALWIVEWADSAGILDHHWESLLRVTRTGLARLAFGLILLGGGFLWWSVPICLDFETKEAGTEQKRQVNVIGYANAFGSPYLIFWSIGLAVVYASTQLTGQVVIALATVALLSWLEVVDSVRDVKSIQAEFAKGTPSTFLSNDGSTTISPPIQFSDIVPLALLGTHLFFATGHQSTISSIQWKSAFMLTSNLVYPWSVVTVALNSIGPLLIMALAAPLLALWNRAPVSNILKPSQKKPSEDKKEQEMIAPDSQVKGESTLAAVGYMAYYATLLLGAAISAAILRRHLMVWKVFAPRFMVGVLGVVVADIGVVLGVGVGVERITYRIGRMFGKSNR
ncbi:hypothetical protein H0H93_010691 [Arthromyces matolae]|nr:hypothetical protein H0H93_010691 [Arthromyces matolae]